MTNSVLEEESEKAKERYPDMFTVCVMMCMHMCVIAFGALT